MAGVTAVVLVSPAVPAQELNIVASAARAGVGHVVKATSKASADSPIARRRGQAEIEAVDRLQPHQTGNLAEARALGLGRHLLARYWTGELTFTSHRRMLLRYYDNSPASVRIHLTRFLGRSLSSADTLDAAVAGRLRELWEARVQAVRNGADATELTAFGEWFGAGKLGDDWELQQLITVLNLAGHIESEHDALPRLAALAPAHTSTCLTVLEAWIRTSPHSWTLQHQEKDIRAIIEASVTSGDAADTETATTIASLCITAGIDLRKTLTGDQ